MLILALDTTTAAGSVALAADARVIEEAAIDPSAPVATRLPGDLGSLLARQQVELTRIDVFAVATGPGSFTGLRIGIATMQGLALAGAKPLVGVSSFDALHALAAPHLSGARLAVWIDAWRGEVYGAAYEGGRQAGEAIVAPPDAAPHGDLHIGSGAVRYRDRLGAARVIAPTPLLAGAVARLAHARAAAGELPPPHAIRPLYVRRPDAELARERR